MSNTDISPNMNMPVPVVGVDPGPDWATNVNACLSIVDSHTHTAGQGVQITPQAININSDLTFAGNNATNLRSVRFTPQSGTIVGASDIGCLYENGVDLYYVDGAGNQVRITQGGSVTGATGTITGLPSGTASASFAGSTFTFQSATNTPASMNVGTIILGQTVASGKNVTIAAAGAQAANYNLTLPIALPAATSYTVSDSSGNLSFKAIPDSQITVYTGAGYGSAIGNRIRVFATVGTSVGSAITLTQDATNGWYFTINQTGIYAISYTDRANSFTASRFGVSVDSSDLTLACDDLPSAEILTMTFAGDAAGGTQGATGTMSITTRLTAGRLLRAQTDGNANTTSRALARFSVTQLAVL